MHRPFLLMSTPAARRTVVYIDGFNFYYGVLKNTPFKWLDLQRFFTLLRPHDQIQAIKFFTSLVNGGSRLARQRALLKALQICAPRVAVIYGRFKMKQVPCPNCSGSGLKIPEEKRTDVNIGIHMLDDAYGGNCDHEILVSGDSDLVPAIKMVRQRFPNIKTTVYVPARTKQRGVAAELRGAAHDAKSLPLTLLPKTQLPARIPDGSGGFIEKPIAW